MVWVILSFALGFFGAIFACAYVAEKYPQSCDCQTFVRVGRFVIEEAIAKDNGNSMAFVYDDEDLDTDEWFINEAQLEKFLNTLEPAVIE